jgi:hypothetical protein
MSAAEVVPIDQIASRMQSWGYEPGTVAALLGLEEEEYNRITQTQVRFIPEDKELADATRSVAWRVMGEIHKIMDGEPPYTNFDRVQVIKLFIPRLSSLLGAQRDINSAFSESQMAVQRIYTAMQVNKEPPIESIPSVELRQASGQTYDPRQTPAIDESDAQS